MAIWMHLSCSPQATRGVTGCARRLVLECRVEERAVRCTTAFALMQAEQSPVTECKQNLPSSHVSCEFGRLATYPEGSHSGRGRGAHKHFDQRAAAWTERHAGWDTTFSPQQLRLLLRAVVTDFDCFTGSYTVTSTRGLASLS